MAHDVFPYNQFDQFYKQKLHNLIWGLFPRKWIRTWNSLKSNELIGYSALITQKPIQLTQWHLLALEYNLTFNLELSNWHTEGSLGGTRD